MDDEVAFALAEADGILQLDPAFVARDWLPPGRRLGLSHDEYDLGERGFICERWLASTTHADNRIGPDDEGVSYIKTHGGTRMRLDDVVKEAPTLIMGDEYARTHNGLGRLAKLFDYGERIPYHIHPPADQAALVSRNPKDEVYYFPEGVDLGKHPETFFGVHPWLAEGDGGSALLQHLEDWKDDSILKHSIAYQQIAEEGFFVESGILHAPGTALTVELQEDSDTLAMFQALNAGKIISKDLLFKDVPIEDREKLGERALLRWIDWEANADTHFYEKRLVVPKVFMNEEGAEEAWILYGSPKFSGKRVRLDPGARIVDTERGVHSIFVWQGDATVGGIRVSGGVPGSDELLIVHDRAVRPTEIVNTGTDRLTLIKFFGPDINPDAPRAGIY